MCPLLSVRFYSFYFFIRFSMNIFFTEVLLSSVVGSSGLEPPTSRLSGARSNHLSYEPIKLFRCISSLSPLFFILTKWIVKSEKWISEIPFGNFWWRWWDSNPWPPACRAGALPTELHPRILLRLLSLAGCWPLPIFPARLRASIVGTTQLNFRVRYGYGWTLCVNGTNYLSVSYSVFL